MYVMHVYLDACVVFYDQVQSVSYTWWVQKQFLEDLDQKKIWSEFKASIAWDHPSYIFTLNHLIHIACVYLVANKDILDTWYLVP